MKIHTWTKRIAAMLLAVAVLAVSVPCVLMPVSATGYDRVSDLSTMDDWKDYFGKDVLSTQNAGGVWTDKSVFTDASAFDGTGITLDENGDNFLVALSAMASDVAVKGYANTPTDIVLVLDLSDPMFGNAATFREVESMLASVQELGYYNRVGVVVYDGDDAVTLLGLDRYAVNDLLNPTFVNGRLVSVSAQTATYTVNNSAASYTQYGVLQAVDELLSADPVVPSEAKYFAGQTRVPSIVLLTNGEPTAATADYVTKEPANLASATEAQRHFVTQLTLTYAKETVGAHYNNTPAQFYTIGLGEDSCANILNPYYSDKYYAAVSKNPSDYPAKDIEAARINRALDGYWDMLLSDGHVDIIADGTTYTVTNDGFEKAQKYYVDEYFMTTDLGEAQDVFLRTLDLQTHYFPTLVDGYEEISGYVTFQDRIGAYMSVSQIKGILIDNVLFSGAMLSRNFITGGGELGSFDSPTSLGDELVWAVQARLGVDTNTARDLLGLAYYHGQLSYTSDTEFSNYIGWYANAAGEFLGFWYDGMTTMPDPEDPSLSEAERPAYIVRSYGFLGAVDETHGTVPSDMMYATVQVREHLVNHTEEVLFSVPASLIPTVTYEVALEEDVLTDFAVTGAEHPIRLVYEVSLDDTIDPLTIHDLVEDDYAHRNADGSISFYTNAFETDLTAGYGKQNTNCYFTPSTGNNRYYYTENTVIYADSNGTLYDGGQPQENAVLYRALSVYTCADTPKTEIVYEQISPKALEKAQQGDGCWYIPAGTVYYALESFVTDKTVNATDTLPYTMMPFVDTKYTYYIGATHGNNGRLTMMPETGIHLQKLVSGEHTTERFSFTITRTDKSENSSYEAVRFMPDGTTNSLTVPFRNSTARVMLGDGESLFILGMAEGAQYTVREEVHAGYVLSSVNGDPDCTQAELTLENARLAKAVFTNSKKGYGGVAVINRITHDFGASYVIPDKEFTFIVDLPASYANTTIAAAHSEDPALTSVTTDENGSFTITMKHTDQFELTGLLEGTQVTVTETGIPAGFTPTYYGAGVQGASSVTVRKDQSVSVVVVNDYNYEEVKDVNITVGGTKTLIGRDNDEWLDSDVFTFELQRYENGAWQSVARRTADKSDPRFDFTDVMQAQRFTESGNYSFQVVEIVGEAENVIYDRTLHTFTVTVGDRGMCGQLHILDVTSYHEQSVVTGDEEQGFTVTTDFTNIYTVGGQAYAAVDIETALENPSCSDRVSVAGYRFGLFAEGEDSPVFVSDYTDMIGEARLIASFDAPGSYSYTLRELIPADAVAGMQYSDEEYTVTIDVTQDAAGALTADVTIEKSGEETALPLFTNTYAPSQASFLPLVYKELRGRDLQDSEFTFRVMQGDDVLATGTNTADGEVVFDREIEFTVVGDYYYDVVEVEGAVSGIEYDRKEYRVHVTVTDSGNGALTAHYHVINTVDDIITFRNFYKAEPVKVVVEGFKQLVGRTMINEEFTFVLVDALDPRGLILSASNFTDGTFRFDPITFYEVGEYHYSVMEVHESTTHGIEFDDTKYDVLVSVTDDGSGVLQAKTEIVCDEAVVSDIVFTNHYTTTPADVMLDGAVELNGRGLEEGEFGIELYEADESWDVTALVDTALNDANGEMAFSTLRFESAGVYRFIVKAQNSGMTVDGVTYDSGIYRVLIVVTDNNRGTLSADVTLLDATNTIAEVLAFRHTYDSAPTTSVTTTTTTVTTTLVTSVATTTTIVPSGTTSTDAANPPTGDTSTSHLFMVMLLVSGAAVAVLTRRKTQHT